jgi:putative intracellular protease/amidase
MAGWVRRLSCRRSYPFAACHCTYCYSGEGDPGTESSLINREINFIPFQNINMQPIRVLFITTSHDMLGDTNNKTGVWLEELAAPYYVFKEAGADLTIASPKGGEVPIDPKSESIAVATKSTKLFLNDPEAMDFISHSSLLEDVKAIDFDVLFLPGGHGPMWDIAKNDMVTQLLEAFNNENKPIALVCHGVAGILSAKNNSGDFLIKGKQVTGFSNSEEESAGLTHTVPFLLETELVARGALYSKGPNHVSYMVADGNIITGQNPASSEEAAKKIIAMIKLKEYSTEADAVLS